jgi:protein-S-isoprenylcysteine O-methyltransferase Ste14
MGPAMQVADRPSSLPLQERLSPWILIPPPLLFVLPLLAGTGLQRLLPLPLLPAPLARVLALVALCAAPFFVLVAPILFAIHKTTIVPHGKARMLLERGPYAVSRNPMYVGLVLAYLGVALLLRSAWSLPLLALPLWVLQAKVIPFEERLLAQTFGQVYRDYQVRVRRWI